MTGYLKEGRYKNANELGSILLFFHRLKRDSFWVSVSEACDNSDGLINFESSEECCVWHKKHKILLLYFPLHPVSLDKVLRMVDKNQGSIGIIYILNTRGEEER